jgi:uncharacterized glyoxalase superfamily protein PhnB
MAENETSVSPYLFYQDGIAAMRFLEQAFGFRERMSMLDEDGNLRHGEMALGDAVIMLGCPPDFRNPKQLGQVTVGMYVHVPDVDAHYERARAAGADIDGPPADQPYGERNYGARDPEGHQWWFARTLG